MLFEYSEPHTNFEKFLGGYYYVNAFGPIEQGDDDKFQAFIANHSPSARSTIYIDSVGGDVETAIAIGFMIRKGWYSTAIGQYRMDPNHTKNNILQRNLSDGHCYSAATLLFIGGKLRYFSAGAKFGVHQFSFKNPSPSHISSSQILSAKIANYVVAMGIAPEFLEISSVAPPEQLTLVDEPTLQKLNVVTGGHTSIEWTMQARDSMLYVRGKRDTLYGHQKVMLCYTKSLGFMFWSVFEAQGREDELIRFSVVEIILNDELTRIDISERCERLISGIYLNVTARISNEEARKIAFSDSFGVQIKFSTDAPVFFGVSAISTEGGNEQLETFYETLSSGYSTTD